MKSLSLYTLLFLLCTLCSSCSSTSKLVVRGTPGTIITSTDNARTQLGQIDGSGKAVIKLNRNRYYPFLFSKSPYSNEYIPFALDYKNKNKKILRNAVAYLGSTIVMFGAAAAAVGIAVGDEAVLAIGGGMALGGALLILPALGGGDDVEHSYEYLNQQTNNDLFDSRNNRWY